jgi:DNA-binding NarL/FixJ family response regulator
MVDVQRSASFEKPSWVVLTGQPRVLIAEDNFLISLDLEKILSDFGCQVIAQAASVSDGLKAVDSRKMDFALIDYRLADGTSEALTRALTNRSIPFAYCTGQPRDDVIFVSQRVPVIWKPFLPDDVFRAIEQLPLSPSAEAKWPN